LQPNKPPPQPKLPKLPKLPELPKLLNKQLHKAESNNCFNRQPRLWLLLLLCQ
jgi:hypothetical protein